MLWTRSNGGYGCLSKYFRRLIPDRFIGAKAKVDDHILLHHSQRENFQIQVICFHDVARDRGAIFKLWLKVCLLQVRNAYPPGRPEAAFPAEGSYKSGRSGRGIQVQIGLVTLLRVLSSRMQHSTIFTKAARSAYGPYPVARLGKIFGRNSSTDACACDPFDARTCRTCELPQVRGISQSPCKPVA